MESGGHDGRSETEKMNLRPFAARAADAAVNVEESADTEAERMHPKGRGVTVGEVREHDMKRKRALTEREKLRLQRQRKLIRAASIAILAVAMAAVLLLAYFLLIVDTIEIDGCSRFTDEEILARSGLSTGRHIWLMNTAKAETLIEEDPYIAKAEISRVYPDKLVITVTERSEAAVIVGMNVQAVIDASGYVLYIGARADYSGLIKVSGMGSGGYRVNQRLGEESDFNSSTLIALLSAIYAQGIQADIDIVDMSNPLSITMTTVSGLKLHIGQPDELEQKLSDYKTVLPELVKRGMDSSGTLDLSAKGDPVYSPVSSAAPEDSREPVSSPEPGGSAQPDETPDPEGTGAPESSPSPAQSARPGGFSG